MLTSLAALGRMGFENFDQGVDWNDEPGRTVEEVIARVEGAILVDVDPGAHPIPLACDTLEDAEWTRNQLVADVAAQ